MASTRPIRHIAMVFFLTGTPALAQEALAQPADYDKEALTYELQECVGAKLRVTAQLLSLRTRLAASEKRADDAEAKLKAADEHKPAQ